MSRTGVLYNSIFGPVSNGLAAITGLCASIVIRQRVSPEDDHFKFIGRVLGLGIVHQCFLDVDFSVFSVE